jgi:long-chain fatty acid transport protein
LVPKVEFDSSVATGGGSDGGNAGEFAGVPSFFYTKVLSEHARLGFSITAPLGGGIDYGDNFVGRYAVQNVTLQGVGFTPAYAYKVNDHLSLGIGLSIVYTQLEQEIAINTAVPGDGKAKFDDLDDWGFQGILGLTYKLSDKTLLGVVYRSELSTDLEGKLKVRGTPIPLPDQDIRLQWDNPQWLEIGVRHNLDDKQTLLFNLGWQEWSTFSENTLEVTSAGLSQIMDRNWDNTWHAGVAYVRKLTGKKHFYSLGLAYESSPVEDEHRTFDFPVDEIFKLAGSYTWEGGKGFDFNLGTTLYLIGDAAIDQTEQGVRAAGDFDKNMILLLGGTLRYVF